MRRRGGYFLSFRRQRVARRREARRGVQHRGVVLDGNLRRQDAEVGPDGERVVDAAFADVGPGSEILGIFGTAGWARRLAGTASEELIFGQPSTGADADLERATRVASLMVGRYGMSEKLGKVHLLRIEGNEFIGGEMVPNDLASQPVLEEMHAEISRMLDAADEQAKELLRTHRPLLDDIVARLLEHESLEGDELAALLHPVRPRPRELPVPVPGNGRSTPAKAPEGVRPRSSRPLQDES